MFEKVLFATDFSEYAKKTLDCIAGLPGAREIILFHVIEEARSPRGGGEIGNVFYQSGENFLKEEKCYLESLSQDIRVTTAVKISSDTAGAIIETAKENGVSLIIIGARGGSRREGVFLGSVSTSVLRRSRTSVLIMRHKVIDDIGGKILEKFCPMILFRILCPIDFSQYSERAIDFLSRTKGVGEVILLHIVPKGETDAETEDAIVTGEGQLETIRINLLAQGIRVRIMARAGDPAAEITKIADEEDVSVIWMSSYGKGWFRELVLGSTASAVATKANRPVIIIRPSE